LVALERGLIQVYTGDGKGKTSAGVGQALRASGRGLRCLVHQFFKLESEPSGEQLAGSPIVFRRGDFRHPFFDKGADRAALRGKILAALHAIEVELAEGRWDLVVLDEVNNALRDKFVTWEEFDAFLRSKPPQVELVCTGRGAPPELLAAADYVTEFRKQKHPVDQGIAARKGVEF
jgi:cob(I)alamin adenosyltransferase